MKWLNVFLLVYGFPPCSEIPEIVRMLEYVNGYQTIQFIHLNKSLSWLYLGSAHTVLTPYWSKQLGKKKLYGNFSSVFCKTTGKLYWFNVNKLKNKQECIPVGCLGGLPFSFLRGYPIFWKMGTPLEADPPHGQNDRRLWKHYLRHFTTQCGR